MAQIDNLSLEVRERGVFLVFVARDGVTAAIEIDRLAAQEVGEAREVLRAWCEDRRANRRPQGLPEQPHRLLAQDYTD